MSSQITKITSCDLRNGILRGLKSTTSSLTSNSGNNKILNRKFTSNSNNNNDGEGENVVTKKARSQIIREKKQTDKEEMIETKIMVEALDKDYDGKSYSSHYRDDPDRLKYKSPYSGRDLPYIPSTMDLLTNGYAITSRVETENGSGGESTTDLYKNARLKNYEEDSDEIGVGIQDEEGGGIDEDEDDIDDLYSEGGGFRYAQVNLNNVDFEFVPNKKTILHPEIAKLSKPNQEQFIKMVNTISRVFDNLDQYLREYAEMFTKYELTYFETAMKVLRQEYIENPAFRKSFNKNDGKQNIALSQVESVQANKDIEILLTNLLKDLHEKKAKHGIASNPNTPKKPIGGFTFEQREEIKGEYCKEKGIELDQDLDRELDEEIDEMEQEEFEDDTLERSRYLQFDMEAFVGDILGKDSKSITLFDHLKQLESPEQRKQIIQDFIQFKSQRDVIRDTPIIPGNPSMNQLVKNHIEYMGTETAIFNKLNQIKDILLTSGVVATKVDLVEQIKLNTTLLEPKELDQLKLEDEGLYNVTIGQEELAFYDQLSALFDNEEGLESLIQELRSNLNRKEYPAYEAKKRILLNQLQKVTQENQDKLNAMEFAQLTGELKQLLDSNSTASLAVASSAAAVAQPLTGEALAVRQQELADLKSMLEIRIKENYDLKKGEQVDELTRLEEGINMFKQMGLDIDLELVEKIIFNGDEDSTTPVSEPKESDLYEPVQLIKALYRLGPNKFQDAVEGLKRLPNMVYYCQYMNNHFLDPSATYIAPLSMFEPKDALGPRLNYNSDDDIGFNHPIVVAENRTKAINESKFIDGEEGENGELFGEENFDREGEEEEEQITEEDEITTTEEDTTSSTAGKTNQFEFITTTNNNNNNNNNNTNQQHKLSNKILEETNSDPLFIEDAVNEEEAIDSLVEHFADEPITCVEDFKDFDRDQHETTESSDELTSGNEVEVDQKFKGISDANVDDVDHEAFDKQLNSLIKDEEMDSAINKFESKKALADAQDLDLENDTEEEVDVTEETEDADDDDSLDLKFFPKDVVSKLDVEEQVEKIRNSFPFFGVDDTLNVADVVFDDEGEANMADNIFLLEASNLLKKGNILENPNNTKVYLDPIEDDEDDETSPLEKMGYSEEDLTEDAEDMEESVMEEEEEEDDEDGEKEQSQVANDDNEMQHQYKDENDWRDIPSLHISNLVDVSRHVKVTKAGRVSSYSCTVFNGDGNGSASLGYGKGDTASSALKRASRDAERNAFTLDRYNDLTLPSGLDLKHRSTKIRFFKSRNIDQMDYRGMKQNIILPTIGLHGVTFRTYGRRGWDNVLLTLQKCLPGYTNPEEAARIMGKRFVTPNKEKEKKKTLSELLQSKLEKRNNDPYNLGMVSKFLYDVEEKPNMEKIKQRRAHQELLDLFDRYPTSPKEEDLHTNSSSSSSSNYQFNNLTKRIDKMNQKGRKHERNIKNNSL